MGGLVVILSVSFFIIGFILICLANWCKTNQQSHEQLETHYSKNMLLLHELMHRVRHLEEGTKP